MSIREDYLTQCAGTQIAWFGVLFVLVLVDNPVCKKKGIFYINQGKFFNILIPLFTVVYVAFIMFIREDYLTQCVCTQIIRFGDLSLLVLVDNPVCIKRNILYHSRNILFRSLLIQPSLTKCVSIVF